MTLELMAFIGSILFGILIYWRESSGNRLYQFFNKLMYSKELQMKPGDKTGFIYQQKLALRIVFMTIIYMVFMLIFRFLIPIDLATISVFASGIVGSILGTYLANFIFKSSAVIEEKSDSLGDMVKDTVDKGKEMLEDLKEKVEHRKDDVKPAEKAKTEPASTTEAKEIQPEKSARERLKDKGLL